MTDSEIEKIEEEEHKKQYYNETIVTLRIPKSYYKTAWVISHLQGYRSLDDCVSDALIANIEMHVEGDDCGGEIVVSYL